MADLEFGPVELILAAFDGDKPNAGVIEAVMSLADAGTIRLLDLVQVSRSRDGEISYLEIDESGIEIGQIDLAARGLASQDDLNELAVMLPLGTSALLLIVEFRWARHLASQLAAAGGFVAHSVRIPAPVVSAVVAEARAVSNELA